MLLQAVALCVALAGAGAAYIATAETVPSSISHNPLPAQEEGSDDDAPVTAVSVEDWDVDFTMIAPLQAPSAALEPLLSKEGNVAVDPDSDAHPSSQQPHPMPQLYLQYVTASKGQVSWQLVTFAQYVWHVVKGRGLHTMNCMGPLLHDGVLIPRIAPTHDHCIFAFFLMRLPPHNLMQDGISRHCTTICAQC